MIANFATDATQWPTIELDAGVGEAFEVDQHSGLAVQPVDEVAGLPGTQLGLRRPALALTRCRCRPPPLF